MTMDAMPRALLERVAKALATCEVEGQKKSVPWKKDMGLMEFLRML